MARRNATRSPLAAMAVLCCLTAGVAAAAPPPPNATIARTYADRFLDATHAREKLNSMVDHILEGTVAAFRHTHPELNEAKLQEFGRNFKKRMAPVVEKVRDLQMRVLMRNYSADELKVMAAFFASPAGQHFQKMSLKTMSEIDPSRQEWTNDAIAAAMRDTHIKPKSPAAE